MSTIKVMRFSGMVNEVSVDPRSGGPMVPTARVIIQGHGDYTSGEFTMAMEDAPTVGDQFTVFVVPGDVSMSVDGE